MANQAMEKQMRELMKEVKDLRKALEEVEAKKKDAEFKMQERDQESKDFALRIDLLEKALQENGLRFLNNVKEFKLGEGATSIKMDRQGLWVGKDTFEEAIGDVDMPADGPDGTAIAIDGTLYAKDGYSGADFFLQTAGMSPTGKTITVVNGIITDIS